MLEWVLVLNLLVGSGVQASVIEVYPTMTECFTARDKTVEEIIGKPIVGYQVICIIKQGE